MGTQVRLSVERAILVLGAAVMLLGGINWGFPTGPWLVREWPDVAMNVLWMLGVTVLPVGAAALSLARAFETGPWLLRIERVGRALAALLIPLYILILYMSWSYVSQRSSSIMLVTAAVLAVIAGLAPRPLRRVGSVVAGAALLAGNLPALGTLILQPGPYTDLMSAIFVLVPMLAGVFLVVGAWARPRQEGSIGAWVRALFGVTERPRSTDTAGAA